MDTNFPGWDIGERGLVDLTRGVESADALLVPIGAARLRGLGLTIESPIPDPERRLYQMLAADEPESAHARYNALIGRLVSFERAAACVNPRT